VPDGPRQGRPGPKGRGGRRGWGALRRPEPPRGAPRLRPRAVPVRGGPEAAGHHVPRDHPRFRGRGGARQPVQPRGRRARAGPHARREPRGRRPLLGRRASRRGPGRDVRRERALRPRHLSRRGDGAPLRRRAALPRRLRLGRRLRAGAPAPGQRRARAEVPGSFARTSVNI
ncbi:MAG: hypothetical protein AVDCRST_MAG01-01-5331, partial [uncultured Rubrobacteraceae bacterium]